MAGAASVVVGISMITGLIHWFSRQPHVDLEPAVIPSFGPGALRRRLTSSGWFPGRIFAPASSFCSVCASDSPKWSASNSGRYSGIGGCVGWGVKFALFR